jgi:phosphoribosylformylglycinamidine synthase
LFSESSSRIVISASRAYLDDIRAICAGENYPIVELGVVGGGDLKIDGEETFEISVRELRRGYHESIPRAMGYDPNDPGYAISEESHDGR